MAAKTTVISEQLRVTELINIGVSGTEGQEVNQPGVAGQFKTQWHSTVLPAAPEPFLCMIAYSSASTSFN